MSKVMDWVKGKTDDKFQFMSLIGGAFVFFFLAIMCLQFLELNFFFRNGRITIEIWERLSVNYTSQLREIVMIVVLYFFKNTLDKVQEKLKEVTVNETVQKETKKDETEDSFYEKNRTK
jgi:hypothetical protein